MLFYDFKDYEGFKERFGMQEHGNGAKSRKNKILLSWIKQNSLLKKAIAGDREALRDLNVADMGTLKNTLLKKMRDYTEGNFLHGLVWVLYSEKYKMDGYNGICEDGDYRAIRYINTENGRVFKMKAGKFLHNVLNEFKWGRDLPEPIQRWLEEEFTQEWETHTRSIVPEYELHVDDNFRDIYDSGRCLGGFGSCMVDDGYWTFYRDSVKAKAAYLTNADDDIIARCIIFTEVHDMETGETLRLAERQYSSGCEDVLKRCLVDALIKAGEIDGYKKVGADCHSSHSFVRNNGDSLSDHDMWIRCDLDYGDTLSYQDSFKYYDMGSGKAYNDSGYDYDAELDTTDGALEGGRNYDSWNEEYTNDDTVTVYYHGREYACNENNLDDFYYIDYGYGSGEYHHRDDCEFCVDIEDYVLGSDANYSTILDEYYYDPDKMEEEEQEYKEENWYYSEYDEEYYEDECDVKTMHFADGRVMTISFDSACDFEFEEREDGELYELVVETVEVED